MEVRPEASGCVDRRDSDGHSEQDSVRRSRVGPPHIDLEGRCGGKGRSRFEVEVEVGAECVAESDKNMHMSGANQMARRRSE